MNRRYDTFQEIFTAAGVWENVIPEKLVRDKIGEKIQGNPEEKSLIRVVQNVQEKAYLLTLKVIEECIELEEAMRGVNMDAIYSESGDVLEAIDALIKTMPDNPNGAIRKTEFLEFLSGRSFDVEKIVEAQKEKRRQLGGFDGGYVLKI